MGPFDQTDVCVVLVRPAKKKMKLGKRRTEVFF